MRGRQNIIDPGDFRSETKSEKARASANVNLRTCVRRQRPAAGIPCSQSPCLSIRSHRSMSLWVCGRRLNLRLARPRSTSLLALLLLCFFVHIATDVPGFCRLHVDGYIERKLSVACRVETNLVILCNCSCIVHLPIISSSFGNCSCTVKLPRFVTAAILLCLRLPMQRLWDVSVHETWHS